MLYDVIKFILWTCFSCILLKDIYIQVIFSLKQCGVG